MVLRGDTLWEILRGGRDVAMIVMCGNARCAAAGRPSPEVLADALPDSTTRVVSIELSDAERDALEQQMASEGQVGELFQAFRSFVAAVMEEHLQAKVEGSSRGPAVVARFGAGCQGPTPGGSTS